MPARPEGEWAVLGGVQVHTTGLPVRQWNGTFVTDPRTDLAHDLARAANWFGERGMPYGVLVPAEWQLDLPGHRHEVDQPVMLRGLRALPAASPPRGATLTWASAASSVARIQAEAFDTDGELSRRYVEPLLTAAGWSTVTASVGDDAVGCASVAVTGSVAGLYGIAVRHAWRGRGVGTALTAALLGAAAERGCDLAYLNPSGQAKALYTRLGFEDALPMRVWLPTSG